jgi:hypothetical protein
MSWAAALRYSPRISFSRFFKAVMRSFILSDSGVDRARFFVPPVLGTMVGAGAWQ